MPGNERTQTDAQLVNAELGGSADAHEKSDSVTKESLAVLRARTDFQDVFAHPYGFSDVAAAQRRGGRNTRDDAARS